MSREFGQDWMKFYEDENWGVPDYPYRIPVALPTAVSLQPQLKEVTIKEAEEPAPIHAPVEVKKAGIFEKIPTWGWLLIGVGALMFLSSRERR